MADRRETLKIIGAVGTTCAFPFAADELYGQHVHSSSSIPSDPAEPEFFKPAEFLLLARITDLIIPPTETPGASAAGVPLYIDTVVRGNAQHRKRFRSGLKGLDSEARKRFRRTFVTLSFDQQMSIVQPLSDAIDKREPRTDAERFFRVLKNITADGYYTSRIGLVDELGYAGNTVLGQFPECVHEH